MTTTTNETPETVQRVPLSRIHLSQSAYQVERRRRREAREREIEATKGPALPGLDLEHAETTRDLVASVAAHGITQPLIVREMNGPKHLELVAGERRFLAAKEAGLAEVPVIVRDYPDGEAAALGDQITENLHRDDCSPVEEAIGMRELMQAHGLTQAEAGRRLGRDVRQVQKRLTLLRLPAAAQAAVARGAVSINAGQLLAQVPEAEQGQALEELLSPPEAPDQPLHERAALDWLQGRYVIKAKARELWEARGDEMLGMYGATEAVPFEECWESWDLEEAEPKHFSRWRLVQGPVAEAVLRKVGLVDIVKPGATWADLVARLEGAEVPKLLARDGRGSPVLVYEVAPLMSLLEADFGQRLRAFAAAGGISLAKARQLVAQGAGAWLEFHGIVVEPEDPAPGEPWDGDEGEGTGPGEIPVTEAGPWESLDEATRARIEKIDRMVNALGQVQVLSDEVKALLETAIGDLVPEEFVLLVRHRHRNHPAAITGLIVAMFLAARTDPQEQGDLIAAFEAALGIDPAAD